MIYVLEIVDNLDSFCSSIILYNTLSIIKKSLSLIQMIGPILTIVALAISLIKLTLNPDEKKYKNEIKNALIATVVLFMIPSLINATMRLLDDSSTISNCWNNIDNNSKIINSKKN